MGRQIRLEGVEVDVHEWWSTLVAREHRQVPDFLECERSLVTTCRVESICRTNNVTSIIITTIFSSNSEGIVQKRMRCCTPFDVIKRVKIPSFFHVTFVLVNKFVCDTHLFSTLSVEHVLITLEGVKCVLFYTIPCELDEKVVRSLIMDNIP